MIRGICSIECQNIGVNAITDKCNFSYEAVNYF